MDNSCDEYDAYDLSEFSAADLVHIDHTATATRHDQATTAPEEEAAAVVGTGVSGSLPRVAVALEPAADESVVVKVADGGGSGDNPIVGDATRRRSPLEEFRRRGTLSVSDLVGPAWCGVQFDYGLRQGRSLAPALRPESFVSAGGKEMKADKKVAEVNEKTLGRGRSVHKKLEREVFPKQVKVDIRLNEEYWAIRLVNMLACLGTLAQLGYSREMPVFGIVQDYPIAGIIDEILLKSIPQTEAGPNPWNKRVPTSAPGTPRKSKKRREPPPTQLLLTDYLASSPEAEARKSVSPPRPMVHELSLVDTKTRRSNSLPSDDDAFSSRMQLMLYHHLLSALLSPTFSFNAFWEKINVDPSAQLSDKFLLQSGLSHETDGGAVLGCAECLDDLADLWHTAVHSLQVQGVSPTLEIVYRTQSKRRGAAAEVSHPSTSLDEDFGAADREARGIARAIEASRQEYEPDSDLQRAIAESLRDVTPKEDGKVELADSNFASNTRSPSPQAPKKFSDTLSDRWYTRSAATENTQLEAVEKDRQTGESGTAEPGTGASKPEERQSKTPKVIGRKSFAFDETAMHAYVQDVLQWWSGERPPRGVDVEHSRRCFSCEYREDCEWREMKAKEAQEKFVERKFC